MAVELLARVCAEIEQRLTDLRPVVAEYERLIGVTDALGADGLGADGLSTYGLRTGEPPSAARPKATGRLKRDSRSKGAGGPNKPARRSLPGARVRGTRPSKTRTVDSAAGQAIVAALEHGSHTVAELVLVSALPGAEIRAGLRPLLKAGTVTRAKRDGRTAYALARAA